MKVMLITDIPNPYRIPLFNLLNGQLVASGHQLKVVFGSDRQHNRLFELDMADCQFDYEILPTKRYDLGHKENTIINYKGLIRSVRTEQPDKIIVIGFTIATMKLWWRSFFRKTHYLIWTGSIASRWSEDQFLRSIQRKQLIGRATGFVVYGSRAKSYLESMGAAPSKVHIAINTTDTQFFRERTEQLRSNETGDGKFHLLSIGYLNERKNVKKILNAIKLLKTERSDFILDIVGDGDEKVALENYTAEHNLQEVVKFHGFMQKEQLPSLLAQSTLFLFQTDFDIWGLALIEAMAAGLPALASIHAGAAADVIEEGRTGFMVDFVEPRLVVEKINWLLDRPEQAHEMGKAASKLIEENVSLTNSVDGFMSAIQQQ